MSVTWISTELTSTQNVDTPGHLNVDTAVKSKAEEANGKGSVTE